jgi:hypothetical protein
VVKKKLALSPSNNAASRIGAVGLSGLWATSLAGPAGLQLQIDPTGLMRAERTMPIECATAFVRHGLPHLLFAQMDPFGEHQIARALLVRYNSVQRFKERVGTNEPFRTQLESMSPAPPEGRGFFSSLIEDARTKTPPGGDVPAALVDADLELMAVSESSAAIIFLKSSATEVHQVVSAGRGRVWFAAEIEVTMPGAVLVDLLDSWKTVAREL